MQRRNQSFHCKSPYQINSNKNISKLINIDKKNVYEELSNFAHKIHSEKIRNNDNVTQKDYIELLTCINNAPDFLENEQIFKFYKFNVAKNQFSELNGIKNFSVIVDGICIKN